MLRLIFWIFVLLLGLSYLNISIQSIMSSPAGQENFGYVSHMLSEAWDWMAAYVDKLNEFKISSIM